MNGWQQAKRLGRGLLRRRKRLLILSTVMGMLLLIPAAYHLSKEPPRYQTSAVVLLEARPDRVPVFQEFSPFRPLPVQIAILQSRSLAETVIEQLPQTSLRDLIDNAYHVDWEEMARNGIRRYMGQEIEVGSPQQRALKELRRARVKFDVSRDGIVTLTAEASRPQVSLDIVNAYIEALMARTRSFNIDDARLTREFLEQHLADVKKSMSTTEHALRAFMAAQGGIKLPDRNQATMAQLSQTETALAEIETNRKMLHTRLEGLREKVENQKRTPRPAPAAASAPIAAAAAVRPSPEIQRLRTLLAQLEGTLLELRTKYTEEHPRVRLVQDRIAEVRAQVGEAVKESSAPVVAAPAAVPPVERVNFAEQLVAVEASYHALVAQEEALRKNAESLRHSLKGLSTAELEYARLAREADTSRNLHGLLQDKLNAARIREQGEMKVVKVIDPPAFPQPAVNQKRVKYLTLASVLALALGAGVPVAVEVFHKRIESEDDVEEATGLPVLGTIPRIRGGRPQFARAVVSRGRRMNQHLLFTEAFRALRINLQLTHPAPLRSLLIASPLPSEGKSTTVINLGKAFAEVGRRVVIVDSDFQRPTLHHEMNTDNTRAGLVEALEQPGVIEHALAPVSEGMWLVPRGHALEPRSRGMLAGPRLGELFDEMGEHAELIICDSSPVLLVPDNLFLMNKVDGVILVAKIGSTGCRDLQRAKALVEAAGAKILGVVLNEMPVGALKNYYYRYYSYVAGEN